MPEHDPASATPNIEDESPLLDRAPEWMDRWNDIQTRFVDEPRESLEAADALVAEVMNEVTEAFAEETITPQQPVERRS